jgi:hypothetical protein
VSGVKELDEEATQMVADLKEQWMRPPDQAYLAEQERERIFEKENIIIKVIETLQAFGGLQDPRTESVLENYLQTNQFDSSLVQSALTTLAMKDPALAAFHLNEFVPPGRQLNITTRLVNSKMDTDREIIYFSICVRDNEPNSKDRPYSFKVENGLVFFLVRGEEDCKWFVGQAQNKEQAVQTALRYLERWIPKIDDLNADKFGMANHRGEYTGNARYAELAETLQKNLDFKRWGFQESYILPKHYPVIIYDSEWCRICFAAVSGEYPYDHQTTYVQVAYGRLHAPNNQRKMIGESEEYQCWHWDHHFLPFLDGVPPEILAEKFSQSPIVDRYERSEFAKNSAGPIERELGKQAALWEHYGQRLFNLFDLRRPDLWDEYVRYKTEYEKFWAKKMSRSDFSHPKIC